MLNAIKLDSIINKEYGAVTRDMSIADFYKLLAGTRFNIFAVLNTDKELEGVVLMDEIRKNLFDLQANQHTVADIMVPPPAIIDYDQPVTEVMELFDGMDVWQLPVIKQNKFIGFVSKSALLSQYREIIIKQHNETDLFAHN